MLMMLCREFGWTVEYVLEMPARRFFIVYRQCIRLRAIDLVNACDIAAIPMCDVKQYYERLRGGFLQSVLPEQRPRPRLKTDPMAALTGKDALHKVQAIFRLKKRYG